MSHSLVCVFVGPFITSHNAREWKTLFHLDMSNNRWENDFKCFCTRLRVGLGVICDWNHFVSAFLQLAPCWFTTSCFFFRRSLVSERRSIFRSLSFKYILWKQCLKKWNNQNYVITIWPSCGLQDWCTLMIVKSTPSSPSICLVMDS